VTVPPKEGEGPCRESPAGDTGEEARSEVAPGWEGDRDVGSGEGREVGGRELLAPMASGEGGAVEVRLGRAGSDADGG